MARHPLRPRHQRLAAEVVGLHDVSAALNGLLADMFALYVKAKKFHWYVSGPISATQSKREML
jgi:hypothetical protein